MPRSRRPRFSRIRLESALRICKKIGGPKPRSARRRTAPRRAARAFTPCGRRRAFCWACRASLAPRHPGGDAVSPDGQPPSVRCPRGRPRPRPSPARRGQRRPAPAGGSPAKTGAARRARPPASPDPKPAGPGARAESTMAPSRRKALQSRPPGAQVPPPADAPRLEFQAAPAGPGRGAPLFCRPAEGKNRL